jgi:nucleotide-binding universal stress UspA family protein
MGSPWRRLGIDGGPPAVATGGLDRHIESRKAGNHGREVSVHSDRRGARATHQPLTAMVVERNRWIVVGMDFSDGAIRALQYGLEYAKAVGTNVACVHAYEDAPGTPASHDPAPAIRQQLEEIIALRTPTARNVRIDSIVRRGPPWEKLANVATELGADIIVVGADGQRGAAGQGLLGTVVSRLVTTSPRTVVVVPSQPQPDRTAR